MSQYAPTLELPPGRRVRPGSPLYAPDDDGFDLATVWGKPGQLNRPGFRSRGVFTPAQLNKLGLWLRADLGTDTTTNGAAVSSWTDQKGGLAFTQATGSKKPLYVSSSINGKPALAFTFAGVSVLSTATFWSTVTGGDTWCIWAIAVVDSIATNAAGNASAYANVSIINDGNNLWRGIYLRSTGPEAITYFWQSAEGDAWATLPALGTPFVTRAMHLNTGSGVTSKAYMRVNLGVEDARASGPTGGGNGTGIQIGTGTGGSITGRIAEIIMVGRIPTGIEMALVDTYLKTRYALW